MMHWYGDDGTASAGWAWAAMAVGMVVLVALVVAVLVVALRRAAVPAPPALPVPRVVLAGRFARGEIDEDEYTSRSAALQHQEP